MSERDVAHLDLLEAVWTSLDDLGASLTAAEWAAPTDCAGWSVQDSYAHIVGIESLVLGRPTPDVELPITDHVKNDIGRMNELWVQSLRDRSGPEVLEVFRSVTGERLASLRALDDEGWAAETWTPVGPGTVGDAVPFRVFDSWVHEQDVRRAVGVPGDVDTPAGRFNVDRTRVPMGMVVGKRVAPPDGTAVAFRVYGPPFGFEDAYEVRGGRAERLDAAPGEPTVRIVCSLETFVRLGCGRVEPDFALAARLATFHGDHDLGALVVRTMPFTP